MTTTAATEIELWSRVTDMLGDGQRRLGRQWSSRLYRNPVLLALTLSFAKFAAKMACKNRSVLELGCDEGIRSPILSEFATRFVGIDADEDAIAAAQSNWNCPRKSFRASQWPGSKLGDFQSVVCHDVGLYCHVDAYDPLINTVWKNLDKDGLCVLGLHVACSSQEATDLATTVRDVNRLTEACERSFRRVLRFGMNDGLVQPLCTSAVDHAILVGICPCSE